MTLEPSLYPVNPAKPALTAADIVFETADLTPEEVAAVSALLVSAVAEQRSAEEASGEMPMSAWMRSRRPVRTSLPHGPGAWHSI